MSYQKPGVEITEVQRSFSPTLISPDLAAAIVGPAYYVVNSEGDGSFTYSPFVSGVSISLQGLTSNMKLDASSVYADLYMASGVNAGNRLHLESSDMTALVDGATSITPIASPTWNGAKVYIGYRALNYGADFTKGLISINALSDLNDIFGDGQVVLDNPLPFALSLALENTATSVNGVAIRTDEFASLLGSGTTSSEHTRALDILALNEVYAIAPLSIDTSVLSTYRAHCDTYSAPTEKKERITFLNPQITFYLSDGVTTTTDTASMVSSDKAATANARRDLTTAITARRSFYTFPNVCYFKATSWPVQKLKSSYLSNIYNLGTTEYAVLANNYTLANGTLYRTGQPITDTVYAALKADTKYYQFDAFIPVPGCFVSSSIAGQVSGQNPEQGHTNLPIAGPASLKYSNDFFSESQLNTIAGGGNYIMVNTNGAIYSRHQLSTDMTTIERRELNITKSVDFTAKFIRNVVQGYIGRSLITPAFLQVLGTIISGLGLTLVKDGRLNSFKLLSIEQDSVAKDTVRASILIGPKYPVNYIKIDLIF